jgi:predicted deacylase
MASPGRLRTRRIVATLRSGEQVHIPAWVVDSRQKGPHLLLTAAQHGNELQGIEAIRRFAGLARVKGFCGKIFAVPFGNLSAIRQRRPHVNMRPEQMYADDRGHNMNRTWPGRNGGNDTARLSYAVYRAFGDAATHVLDLHTWEGSFAPGVLIADGAELRAMAARLGTRFVHASFRKARTLSGHFCATGRVGITYEFAGQYEVDEQQVTHGLKIMTNFAKLIGLMKGPLQKGDTPVVFNDRKKAFTVRAPCSGLFVQAGLSLRQPVRRRMLLGRILSDKDLKCREVRAPANGYLRQLGVCRPNCDVALPGRHPYVEEGETIVSIWRPA